MFEDDRQHTLPEAARVLGVSREGFPCRLRKLLSASEIGNLREHGRSLADYQGACVPVAGPVAAGYSDLGFVGSG